MMDQFVVWSMHGVTYLCLRDLSNPENYFWLERIKRLPNRGT